MKPVYQFGIPNSDPQTLKSVKINSSKYRQITVHALVPQCASPLPPRLLKRLLNIALISSFYLHCDHQPWKGGNLDQNKVTFSDWRFLCLTKLHRRSSWSVMLWAQQLKNTSFFPEALQFLVNIFLSFCVNFHRFFFNN